MAPKIPSLLNPPCGRKSEEEYQALGTSVSLAQKVGRFFQERNGSRSGLNSRAVTLPRPRLAVTINGFPSEATRTRPSRIGAVATCNSAVSKGESSVGSLKGLLAV